MDFITFVLVFIFLSLIILLHEVGHFFVARLNGVRVDEFGFGYPPRLFGKRFGKTIYSVNALPFGGFVRIFGADAPKDGEPTSETGAEDFRTKSAWKKSLILLAGIAMNVVLGWVLLIFVFMVGSPKHLMISGIADNSPAFSAGFRSGDQIVSVQYGDMKLSDPVDSDQFIALVKEAGVKPLSVTFERNKKEQSTTIIGRENPPEGEGSLGVALIQIGIPRESFFGSIKNATLETGDIIISTAVGLYQFFTRIFTTPGVLDSVAGPVGIFTIAAQASSFGFAALLQLMAILSLNVAILNLIPFPALDGGRFLVVLIEKAIKRSIPQKIQNGINAVGFVVLVGLMILVTIKDVGKIVNGG